MVSRISSLGLFGLNAFSVDVEVDICRGQPHFEIVGLPDASVRESRERIRSALNSISVVLPAKRITVNLAPADVKKSGTMHDLAILIGILQSMGNISADLRQIALIIILTRAGLGLDLSGLKKIGRSAVMMCFVPASL